MSKKTRLSPVDIAWLSETLARNRATFGGWSMQAEGEGSEESQTFTQADVDRIVADRLKREREAVKTKYADYDELKAKAGTATTLEERVAEIERNAQAAEARALRAEVANAKGLTPSQAKRLVGSTKEELEVDADELVKDIGAQKKRNNVSPREGNNPEGGSKDELREFTRTMFARAAAEE